MPIPAFFNPDDETWQLTIPGEEWYSVQQTSRILGIGSTQVYGAIARDTMAGYKVNGTTMVKHEDLQAYIQRRGQSSPAISGEQVIERIMPRTKTSKPHPPAGSSMEVLASVQIPIELQAPTGGLDLDKLNLDEPPVVRVSPPAPCTPPAPPLPDTPAVLPLEAVQDSEAPRFQG